ncbi:MAG TPA: ATP-binding cassette domain-containing protein [Opitutales bacterium]|nr:ATP-binding cassette domain-containing protein [Opitutales bacterium]
MIKAVNLIKDYGTFRAVDRVRFEVHKGDVLGFLGPNGAGKSTTMKMITGFLPPTAGRAEIGGHDITEKPIEAKRLLGYLPESGPLYQEMTVLEFLRFIAEIRGLNASERSKALTRVLKICHLEPVRHQTIETLSKGFRQRVGMAQAILHDPPYLIMDEPTDGLDPNQKQEVRKLIAGMGREKAIILSTHILEEVQAMCNRVIIIARGKVVVDETPEKLLRRHPHFNSVRLSVRDSEESAIREAINRIPKVAKVEMNGDGFLVHPRDGTDVKQQLWEIAREQNWKVAKLETLPIRLEEVFANLTLSTNSEENPKPSSKSDELKSSKKMAGTR